ncbi:MAG: DUF4126 domain-containing protein [Reyranellaceae bacterium]
MVVSLYLLALALGIVAGLRTATAPAVASWAAYLGVIGVSGTWLGFMAHPLTPWILTALAVGELVVDQLPSTPSRKVPYQFAGRIVSGALCGATIGIAAGQLVGGVIAGIAGAIVGTLAGAAARARMAAAFGKDTPAALIEDAVAIGGAVLAVIALT